MKNFKSLILIITAVLILPSFVCCQRKDAVKSATYYEYFDTVCSVYSYASDSQAEFDESCELIEAELKEYHRLFDIYREYSGINNLKTVNLNAGISPVRVDRRLIDLLLYGKEIYALTGGEVNIAMGAVLSLWHECRENTDDLRLPDPDALAAAAEHISIDCIIIDEEASTVYISDKNASVDVGALGKGFATERIAELLKSRGIDSYVLDIGRNIRVLGTKPDGSGWITGISNPDPLSSNAFVARVSIADTACVTSGSYERFFTVDGKSYHHIIDKDTLYPSEHFISVSVITPDSALADALSTALFCRTYEEGAALIASVENAEAMWISTDGERLYTEGFRAMLLEEQT